MSERKKSSKIWILLIAISLFVLIGAIWSWFLFVKKENDGNFINLDSWSSFWGGIIGAGATIIGAFLVMKIQIDEEKNKRKQEIINSNFSDLLNLHEKKLNNVHNILSKKDSLSKIIDSEIDRNIVSDSLDYIYNNKNIISKEIDTAILHIDNKEYDFKKNDFTKEANASLIKEFKKTCQRFKIEVESTKNIFLPSLAKEEFHRLTNIIYLLINDLDKFTIKDSALYEQINKIQEIMKNDSIDNNKEELSKVVTKSINSINQDILAYLDLYTKIIEYIVLNIDENNQKDKLFILNVNLSQEDYLLIFYYSCYVTKGQKLWNMLKKIKNKNYFMLDENALFIDSSKEEFQKIKPAS